MPTGSADQQPDPTRQAANGLSSPASTSDLRGVLSDTTGSQLVGPRSSERLLAVSDPDTQGAVDQQAREAQPEDVIIPQTDAAAGVPGSAPRTHRQHADSFAPASWRPDACPASMPGRACAADEHAAAGEQVVVDDAVRTLRGEIASASPSATAAAGATPSASSRQADAALHDAALEYVRAMPADREAMGSMVAAQGEASALQPPIGQHPRHDPATDLPAVSRSSEDAKLQRASMQQRQAAGPANLRLGGRPWPKTGADALGTRDMQLQGGPTAADFGHLQQHSQTISASLQQQSLPAVQVNVSTSNFLGGVVEALPKLPPALPLLGGNGAGTPGSDTSSGEAGVKAPLGASSAGSLAAPGADANAPDSQELRRIVQEAKPHATSQQVSRNDSDCLRALVLV